ncbi:hypothetical protein B0H13DRAFT_1898567 [Mycena leptocephala]|nr:hypothetical protein B0H13DRAFT_1898567 [Mycena leptocephala]
MRATKYSIPATIYQICKGALKREDRSTTRMPPKSTCERKSVDSPYNLTSASRDVSDKVCCSGCIFFNWFYDRPAHGHGREYASINLAFTDLDRNLFSVVALITEVGIRQSIRIDRRREFPALDTRSPNDARALTIDVIEPVDEANISDLDGPWVTPRVLDRGPAPFTESVLDPEIYSAFTLTTYASPAQAQAKSNKREDCERQTPRHSTPTTACDAVQDARIEIKSVC